MSKSKKVTLSVKIDEELKEKFIILCEEYNLNKAALVEAFIIDLLKYEEEI